MIFLLLLFLFNLAVADLFPGCARQVVCNKAVDGGHRISLRAAQPERRAPKRKKPSKKPKPKPTRTAVPRTISSVATNTLITFTGTEFSKPTVSLEKFTFTFNTPTKTPTQSMTTIVDSGRTFTFPILTPKPILRPRSIKHKKVPKRFRVIKKQKCPAKEEERIQQDMQRAATCICN